MSNWVFGIIIAVMFLVGSNLVYKTFQLQESVLNLRISLVELDLATTEFSCDLQRLAAYEQGHKDANNE